MTLPRPPARDDRGFTIVELMVVVLILSILMGAFYSFLFGGERAARNGREWLELNQTARLALDRLARELREADVVYQVTGSTGVRFGADYNASGGGPSAAEGEILTYRYDAAARELQVSSDGTVTADGTTFFALARNVSSFSFSYFGTDPYLDADQDGVVTAGEIEAGVAATPTDTAELEGQELNRISSVVVAMTVQLGSQRHSYRTGVELRNVFG